jgi:hypothetical protein
VQRAHGSVNYHRRQFARGLRIAAGRRWRLFVTGTDKLAYSTPGSAKASHNGDHSEPGEAKMFDAHLTQHAQHSLRPDSPLV